MNEVGFLLPDNTTVFMPYEQVETYCKAIYEQDASSFGENHHKFPCYFDYVMQMKKYVFINPLFHNDSYLVAEKDIYYRVPKIDVFDVESDAKYQAVQERAKECDFNDVIMVSADDESIGVRYDEGSFQEGFVGNDGIFYDKGRCFRHAILANTIANQMLTRDVSFKESYQREEQMGFHQSIFFLVRKLGFMEVDRDGDLACSLIVNEKMASSIQQAYVEESIQSIFSLSSDESTDSDLKVYIGTPKSKGKGK